MELVAARPLKQPVSTTLHSYWHLESQLVNFLATSEQTDGKYAMLELTIPRGYEPPPHVHSRESESYYILDGEVEFELGNNVFIARKGDFVYMPRYVVHIMNILTPTLNALLFIEPAGLEKFYLETSRLAPESLLPPLPAGKLPTAYTEKIKEALSNDYGVELM